MGVRKNRKILKENLGQPKFDQIKYSGLLTGRFVNEPQSHLVFLFFSDKLYGTSAKTYEVSYLMHTLLTIKTLKTTKFAIYMYIQNTEIS
jgi:hypothetical protein